MIDLQAIQVTFNPGTPLESPALRGIDLQIPEGQFITVIGSNGAGKSTLLNVLGGGIIPQAGRVKIGEQTVTKWTAAQRSPLVSRVFQNPLLGSCADLTVEENLALADQRGQRRGLSGALKRERRQRFRDRLAQLGLGLENRLGDRMGLLSGGQRQAICLLMATLAEHKILLLDEHTAALDPKTAEEVLRITRQLVAEQNLTTLMVTHSMGQALAVGDRTIMLHQGQIIWDLAGEARARISVKELLAKFGQL
jgi:putative tryptophan/tyrosine transport system ATP-binding protein